MPAATSTSPTPVTTASQKFSPNGQFLLQFGTARAATENLSEPSCVTVHTGVVFVCDTEHNNVKRFSTSGVYQGQWGVEGGGPGEFEEPFDIAFDADGYAYVVDFSNSRVQKFDASFEHVLDIGKTGPSETRLDAPTAIAIGTDNRLYVSDLGDTIKVYGTDGSFVRSVGESGSGPGQFNFPRDLALDADGNVYVADTDNDRLQKLDADLQPVWTLVDALLGRLVAPVAIAYSPTQGVLVSDTVGDQARIAFFSPNGEFEGDVRIATGGSPGLAHAGSGVAIAPNGGFYLADSTNQSVAKFSADRGLIKFFGAPGTGPGQFMDPRGVAVDDVGNVFVVDSGNNRVQKFDSNGAFLDIWGGFGTAAGQFDAPQGIAVFGDRVYVADSGNDRVQAFDRSGAFLTQWGEPGLDTPSQFAVPARHRGRPRWLRLRRRREQRAGAEVHARRRLRRQLRPYLAGAFHRFDRRRGRRQRRCARGQRRREAHRGVAGAAVRRPRRAPATKSRRSGTRLAQGRVHRSMWRRAGRPASL